MVGQSGPTTARRGTPCTATRTMLLRIHLCKNKEEQCKNKGRLVHPIGLGWGVVCAARPGAAELPQSFPVDDCQFVSVAYASLVMDEQGPRVTHNQQRAAVPHALGGHDTERGLRAWRRLATYQEKVKPLNSC